MRLLAAATTTGRGPVVTRYVNAVYGATITASIEASSGLISASEGATATGSAPSETSDGENGASKSLSRASIAAIVFGVLVGLVVGLLIYFCLRRRRRRCPIDGPRDGDRRSDMGIHSRQSGESDLATSYAETNSTASTEICEPGAHFWSRLFYVTTAGAAFMSTLWSLLGRRDYGDVERSHSTPDQREQKRNQTSHVQNQMTSRKPALGLRSSSSPNAKSGASSRQYSGSNAPHPRGPTIDPVLGSTYRPSSTLNSRPSPRPRQASAPSPKSNRNPDPMAESVSDNIHARNATPSQHRSSPTIRELYLQEVSRPRNPSGLRVVTDPTDYRTGTPDSPVVISSPSVTDSRPCSRTKPRRRASSPQRHRARRGYSARSPTFELPGTYHPVPPDYSPPLHPVMHHLGLASTSSLTRVLAGGSPTPSIVRLAPESFPKGPGSDTVRS